MTDPSLAAGFGSLAPLIGLISVILGLAALVALGFAVQRTQSLTAWRNAAEGYKEQVLELTLRLERAQERVERLTEKIEQLERRPDMTVAITHTKEMRDALMAQLLAIHDEIGEVLDILYQEEPGTRQRRAQRSRRERE